MPEPSHNPNPRHYVDPSPFVRWAISRMVNKASDPARRAKRRAKLEVKRKAANAPHVIEYFHQLDDPYSHLAAQVLSQLAVRYDVKIMLHLIRGTGGKNQPEMDRLAKWAHRDATLIAPHLGLNFPSSYLSTPSEDQQELAASLLLKLPSEQRLKSLADVSNALWSNTLEVSSDTAARSTVKQVLAQGNARLTELGHYSGAMFYYGQEWYWGVDRLSYLENRLRDLGACATPDASLLCPRPEIDVHGIDASDLILDFYPSLNSPYTSIIYDQTLEIANACHVQLNHKPVLPMIMRGVPATREKGQYIAFDTFREGLTQGTSFGPVVMPVGEPVRQIYSLFPWARSQNKETALLSSALHLAFREGVGLHRKRGLRMAIEQAGLSWADAQAHLGTETWKLEIKRNQDEMEGELDLWGVPSYRLRGGQKDDLCVWGQDRLWLIAAEIRERGKAFSV